MNQMEIGKRIKSLRIRRGLTREKMSEVSGISTSFLYEIETGRKGLSVKTLEQIALALEIPSEYLVHAGECELRLWKNNCMQKVDELENLLQIAFELLQEMKEEQNVDIDEKFG